MATFSLILILHPPCTLILVQFIVDLQLGSRLEGLQKQIQIVRPVRKAFKTNAHSPHKSSINQWQAIILILILLKCFNTISAMLGGRKASANASFDASLTRLPPNLRAHSKRYRGVKNLSKFKVFKNANLLTNFVMVSLLITFVIIGAIVAVVGISIFLIREYKNSRSRRRAGNTSNSGRRKPFRSKKQGHQPVTSSQTFGGDSESASSGEESPPPPPLPPRHLRPAHLVPKTRNLEAGHESHSHPTPQAHHEGTEALKVWQLSIPPPAKLRPRANSTFSNTSSTTSTSAASAISYHSLSSFTSDDNHPTYQQQHRAALSDRRRAEADALKRALVDGRIDPSTVRDEVVSVIMEKARKDWNERYPDQARLLEDHFARRVVSRTTPAVRGRSTTVDVGEGGGVEERWGEMMEVDQATVKKKRTGVLSGPNKVRKAVQVVGNEIVLDWSVFDKGFALLDE
ncbi:hypothetical protein T439DRAFT_334540 [Meredithblackwellia eburnea MCA 4105]